MERVHRLLATCPARAAPTLRALGGVLFLRGCCCLRGGHARDLLVTLEKCLQAVAGQAALQVRHLLPWCPPDLARAPAALVAAHLYQGARCGEDMVSSISCSSSAFSSARLSSCGRAWPAAQGGRWASGWLG